MQSFEVMRLFLHLSRTLHFGRTSEQCRVSPSSLSRNIRQLEKELGVALFARDKRHVALTPEGQRFQSYVIDLLERWSDFQRQLGGGEPIRGAISLFCTVTASQSIVPDLLRRFRAQHPNVQIKMETGYAADALSMLKADSVDVTIAALPRRLPRALMTKWLVNTPLLFVAPTVPCELNQALAKRTISWGDIPMIVPPFGITRENTESWFRVRGVEPTYYSEVSSHEAILSLVSLGCGVGVVPELVLEKSALREDVRPLKVRPSLGSLDVGACVRRTSLRSPLINAFWDLVV